MDRTRAEAGDIGERGFVAWIDVQLMCRFSAAGMTA
jgi:hypothetical protein